jgi:hypothetical protein
MQNVNGHIQAIQNKLQDLQKLVLRLNTTIVDMETSDYLLGSARNSLSDVEGFLLPNGLEAENQLDADLWFRTAEFQLQSAERDLGYAQDVLSKYGPQLRVVSNPEVTKTR